MHILQNRMRKMFYYNLLYICYMIVVRNYEILEDFYNHFISKQF